MFVLALIPLSLILRKANAAYKFLVNFSEDIGMDFGIEKYSMLAVEKGKIMKSVGIELPDGKVVKSLEEVKVKSV